MDLILRKQLIRDEGMRLDAYQDSLGFWTIGIGHFLGTRKRMNDITPAECDALYEADAREAEDLAMTLFPIGMSITPVELVGIARWRVLVNMSFNLGGRIRQFKRFLAAMVAQNWDLAAKEMLASKWAAQVGARAERLAHTIRTGEE